MTDTTKRCGATHPGPDGKLRCLLPAYHDKNVWHKASENQVEARWNDEGSCWIEMPTHRSAA